MKKKTEIFQIFRIEVQTTVVRVECVWNGHRPSIIQVFQKIYFLTNPKFKGTMSWMTFRGCYNKMFNLNDPSVFKPPNHSFCTHSEVLFRFLSWKVNFKFNFQVPLACLSDSSVIEDTCWCQGNFCNFSESNLNFKLIFVFFSLFYLIFRWKSALKHINKFIRLVNQNRQTRQQPLACASPVHSCTGAINVHWTRDFIGFWY